jgi:hypothetical protein
VLPGTGPKIKLLAAKELREGLLGFLDRLSAQHAGDVLEDGASSKAYAQNETANLVGPVIREVKDVIGQASGDRLW